MSHGARRIVFIAAGAVAVWYLVVLFGWALRPLHDSVPVGLDYTLKQPRLVSQEVPCNSLFDGSAFDGVLPALKAQTVDHPQLAYQRKACAAVQRDARVVLGLDSFGAVVVIGGLMYVAMRKPTEPVGSHRDPTPSYA